MLIPKTIKRQFWHTIRPWYKYAKQTYFYRLIAKFFHHHRQHFHLGWLTHPQFSEKLTLYLQSQGFEPQDIAWLDPGEIISLRKTHQHIFQYHLRIFHDGEIRGHLEYQPETYALRHFFEINIQAKHEEFIFFLQNFTQFIPTTHLLLSKTKSHKAPATSRTSPSKG